MPFVKGAISNPAGRPKGALNAVTKTVRETIMQVHQILEEDPIHNMLAFAKKYPKEYRAIEAKLIPTEIAGQMDLNINWEVTKNYDKPEFKADAGD